MSAVVISRLNHGTITREPVPERCYVTGPWFGERTGIYSGTVDRAEATRFTREEAEALMRTKWLNADPRIEEV